MPTTNTPPNKSGGGSPSPSPTHWFEWFNIATGAWWVYLFMLPGSLFLTNPAFNSLANHAPEWAWSLSLLGAACLSLMALLRPRPVLCLLALVVQSGIWAGIATCFALSAPVIYHTPVNTGVGVYGAMSAVNFLLACTHGEAAIASLYRLRAFQYILHIRQLRQTRKIRKNNTPQAPKRGNHGVG